MKFVPLLTTGEPIYVTHAPSTMGEPSFVIRAPLNQWKT